VVSADSDAKRLEDRLGNVLVKQAKLSKEKLEEALQTQKATLQRLGHVLTTNNYITNKDLKDALQVQVSQIVFKVFRWRDGEYHFAPTDEVEYDRDYMSPMSADFILMEGIRMVDEWPIIEKKIPSMDIVFRPVVDAAHIEVAEEGAGEPKRAPASGKVRLTPAEEHIFRRVDGTRTVQAIIDATGVTEFEVCRTLFDLLNRNLISTVGRGAARETELGSVTSERSDVPAYALAAAITLIALLGIFVRRDAPFAVVGRPPLLSASYSRLMSSVTQTRLERLDRAVLAFQVMRGTLPATLDELAGLSLVAPAYLKDPAARPFHYAHTEDGYLLSAVDDAGRPLAATVVERTIPHDTP
jgi:hypothetical protein